MHIIFQSGTTRCVRPKNYIHCLSTDNTRMPYLKISAVRTIENVFIFLCTGLYTDLNTPDPAPAIHLPSTANWQSMAQAKNSSKRWMDCGHVRLCLALKKKTKFLSVTSAYAEATNFRLTTCTESVQKHEEAIFFTAVHRNWEQKSSGRRNQC